MGSEMCIRDRFSTVSNAQSSSKVARTSNGDMDFVCTEESADSHLQFPYNVFVLSAYYKGGSLEVEDVDVSSVDWFYKIQVRQYTAPLATREPVLQDIPGCELAPAKIEWIQNPNQSQIKIQVLCEEGPGSPSGSIELDFSSFTNFSMKGHILFPEHEPSLLRPISKGQKFSLRCKGVF